MALCKYLHQVCKQYPNFNKNSSLVRPWNGSSLATMEEVCTSFGGGVYFLKCNLKHCLECFAALQSCHSFCSSVCPGPGQTEKWNGSVKWQMVYTYLHPWTHFIWFVSTGWGAEETKHWEQLTTAWYLVCYYGSLYDHEQCPADNPGDHNQPYWTISIGKCNPLLFLMKIALLAWPKCTFIHMLYFCMAQTSWLGKRMWSTAISIPVTQLYAHLFFRAPSNFLFWDFASQSWYTCIQ